MAVGCIEQLAMETSTEAPIREHVQIFNTKNALVNTRPTPEGINAIDTFHQFEGVKWIVKLDYQKSWWSVKLFIPLR
jgi:transcription elongation factor SPT6